MEMSLDDIIQKKRIGGLKTRGGGVGGVNKPIGLRTTRPPILNRINRTIPDARSKIIRNNRIKIRDAREKIAPRPPADARLKLMNNPKRTIGRVTLKTNKRGQPLSLTTTKKKTPYISRNDNRMDVMDDYESVFLRRTVHNEFAYSKPMPEIPTFSRKSSPPPASSGWGTEINSDPFDCYQVPVRRPVDMVEPMHLRQLRTASEMMAPPPPKISYGYQADRLSSSMRSRLENTPNPYESEGIFAKMPVEDFPVTRQVSHQPAPSQQHYQHGFRIVVSNLHHSVTQSDIKELFEDIGDLLESRLVRPGVAEVIFKTLADAEEAVDCYHNRQLDGQPMKCLLVKPRASNKPPTAPAIKLAGSSSSRGSQPGPKASVEIDIDALHKVLFRRN